MQPSKSGYPRARRSDRWVMTRRGLLGAAAVIGGAGVADVLHKSKHPAATEPGAGSHAVVAGHSEPGPQPEVVTTTGTTTHTASPPASTPTHSHSPLPHHSDSHQPVGNAPGGRGRSRSEHDIARVEPVKLPPPKVRVRTRPVYSIDELIKDPPKHAIALTVDDGPDPEWTPKVLRLLDKHRMQASFCIIGINADNNQKLVRDVHRAGHVIVNHSYTHIQPFNRQTEKRVVEEITRTQRSIERATKETPQLFRAPGGDWSRFIFRAVAAYGLTPLDWDVDPDDWQMPGTHNIERAMLKGRPGDIVLCHDGGGNRSETVRALRKVLPVWKHRGYTTIPLVVPPSARKRPGHPTKPANTPSESPTPSITPTDSASTTASP